MRNKICKTVNWESPHPVRCDRTGFQVVLTDAPSCFVWSLFWNLKNSFGLRKPCLWRSFLFAQKADSSVLPECADIFFGQSASNQKKNLWKPGCAPRDFSTLYGPDSGDHCGQSGLCRELVWITVCGLKTVFPEN